LEEEIVEIGNVAKAAAVKPVDYKGREGPQLL
jgi:hypothetical protein